ncbi:hypothetical protein AB0O07_23845 [Streptomyces sp. NPDC093085]|uniref:hypothetical protein n=1 Tax=Streptomyces sp. NPDC093085 TaxID=3155068 RepID=UPI0034273BC3
MSLVKLIAQADERGLAASGLACLDRCLPPLSGDPDVLRPLWAGAAAGAAKWPERLAEAREAVDAVIAAESAPELDAVAAAPLGESAAVPGSGPGGAESGRPPSKGVTLALVRTMLANAPAGWDPEPLRAWADTCSVVALEIHQKLDTVGESGSAAAAEWLTRCREDPAAVADAVEGAERGDGVGPLVAGELRRQIAILELLSDTTGPAAAGALHRAMALSTEGQRVLRAVVSRRARARS